MRITFVRVTLVVSFWSFAEITFVRVKALCGVLLAFCRKIMGGGARKTL